MKSKSLILLVLSIGFGIVAAIGISQVINKDADADNKSTPMGPVLVASGDLDLKTELTEENVKIENWPAHIIPPDAVTNLEDITDMVTKTRMSPGMPIVINAIQHKHESTKPPIPDNMKVVAVRVAADDTIGNLLAPGNKVDVIGVFKQRDRRSNHTTTSSRTFLKALEVYSIGNKTSVDNTDKPGNSNATSIVGLLVTEKQSEALVFVQDTGSIKLVLRGDDVVNTGEVEDFQEIKKEVLAVKETPEPAEDLGTEMEIWRGPVSETTGMNSDGSRKRQSEDDKSSGSGQMSNSNGRGNSADRDNDDRGIDDDQYPGE